MTIPRWKNWYSSPIWQFESMKHGNGRVSVSLHNKHVGSVPPRLLRHHPLLPESLVPHLSMSRTPAVDDKSLWNLATQLACGFYRFSHLLVFNVFAQKNLSMNVCPQLHLLQRDHLQSAILFHRQCLVVGYRIETFGNGNPGYALYILVPQL